MSQRTKLSTYVRREIKTRAEIQKLRLADAAPDLLAALKDALDQMEMCGGFSTALHLTDPDLDRAIKKAKRAIAAAERKPKP